MSGKVKRYWLPILTLLLLLFLMFLIWVDWQNNHRSFTFAMLNVGQGDALFIESPDGTQILIDGGPNKKIIGELAKVMPIFDRSIDAIIITNPDQDHIGGLSDVLELYKIGKVFEPGTWSDSKTYANLENEIKNKEIPNLLVRKGMTLDLGDGAKIEILFPDQDVTNWSTNDGSVVARVVFNETEIMLTGDTTIKTEKIILESTLLKDLKSDVLKISHHGANTSTSNLFLDDVLPKYAFISVGSENKYGHPKQEVLNDLENRGIKIFRTDQNGTIVLKSDGQNEKIYLK